jgi:hypothetical protein
VIQDGRNGPALWDALIEAVGMPGTVVAGGCLRDFLLGLEPKDIDIFVPLKSEYEVLALCWRLNEAGMFDLRMLNPQAARTSGAEEDYDEAFGKQLWGVLDGEGLGVPVNIIARCSHEGGIDALVESFDFDVVQFWYSGAGATGAGSAAYAAIFERTATITHDNTLDLSRRRFERFDKRNPGVLRLVDPFVLEFDDL